MRKSWPPTSGKPSWKPGYRSPCAGWLLHAAPGKPKSSSATQAPYPVGLRKVWPARPPTLAGASGHHCVGLWLRRAPLSALPGRSPARGIPLRRLPAPRSAGQAEIAFGDTGPLPGGPAQGLACLAANPRRGQWTSLRRLVAAWRASAIAILPQPCAGDPLAQAGCSTQRRASRNRPRRHESLTRRACARFGLPGRQPSQGPVDITAPACGCVARLCDSHLAAALRGGSPCAGWLLHTAPGKPKSSPATRVPYPAGLRKAGGLLVASPRRGQWTSPR